MVYQYPGVVYNHSTREMKKVHSKEEETALGEAWNRTPLPPEEAREETAQFDPYDPIAVECRITEMESTITKHEGQIAELKEVLEKLQAARQNQGRSQR